MGKYVASARRRTRRLGAHGESKGAGHIVAAARLQVVNFTFVFLMPNIAIIIFNWVCRVGWIKIVIFDMQLYLWKDRPHAYRLVLTV